MNTNTLLDKFHNKKFTILAPDYGNITIHDLVPALKEAIALAKSRIEAIVNNAEAPTFENTIVALEFASMEYRHVMSVINAYDSQYGTKEFNDIYKDEITPLSNDYQFFKSGNKPLFDRIRCVQDNAVNLNTADKRLLNSTFYTFVDKGALLDKRQTSQIKRDKNQIRYIRNKFSNQYG
jgi:peptidyl-dipeptidase Dcp